MPPLCKKLNLRERSVVHLLNAPASFEPELAALDAASAKRAKTCDGDLVLWMVYRKGTSEKYKCEFNRDSGWPELGAAGFEPVRKTMTRNPAGAIPQAGKRKTSTGGA